MNHVLTFFVGILLDPVNSAARYSGPPPSIPLISSTAKPAKHCDLKAGGLRLNKFVRRLHEMLKSERNSSVVEWRRGLLVLYSTDTFAKKLLPKYFNTRNFKTFRRQVGLVFVGCSLSFSSTNSFHFLKAKLLRIRTCEIIQYYWIFYHSSLGQP